MFSTKQKLQMSSKLLCSTFFLCGIIICFNTSTLLGKFPPTYIYKVSTGSSFFKFEIPDLTGRIWTLNDILGKPTILLTGHRDVRYDIDLWANFLNETFSDRINLLWVVNLSQYPWDKPEKHAKIYWESFNAKIPILLDWHSQIGRSVKVVYSIPNIIGLDERGILAFHETKIFSKDAKIEISSLIRRLIDGTFHKNK